MGSPPVPARHTRGEQLFGRYAYSPNELGYCGPAGAAGLAAVARGENAAVDVRGVASRFSGAWAYQVVIADMLGLDPLDAEVVRGYWTGTAATAALDRQEFWARLLAVIGPQAGSYWKHLDAALAVEAAPNHAFHVLGVYPWTRLLTTGRPEPVQVIDSCCIRPATVVGFADEGLVEVEAASLRFTDGVLSFDTVSTTRVESLFVPDLAVGERVALHWGAICDRLTSEEASLLGVQLGDQVRRVNARLSARPLA
ncbi:hypothetical protein KPL76_10195 [Subtercola sp. PAMC28395]|uniref:DUF6390 family protein n=1 Tax=Subtercola sp. PAMC28395 TaxID=2846775 RepID=UPI001C0D9AC8|nr:DUF6390 family protein [Subtercola sp. PAMC28395]QWT23119.1 hypothetical protein KPL76_10195 [Subtercola sp. PAMC28395]